MSQNNNFAYHVKMFKKEKSYLAWYHPTTCQPMHLQAHVDKIRHIGHRMKTAKTQTGVDYSSH